MGQYDFMLGGYGYMLVRPAATNNQRGRSWIRSGATDAPVRRSPTDTKYGDLPDEIDHPDVWDDWSGGYGDAYRDPNRLNRLHWSENMETRFPRAMMHAQELQLLPQAAYASTNINVEYLIDVPPPVAAGVIPPAGAGAVLALGRGFVTSYTPTNQPNTVASMFDRLYEATGGGATNFGRKPAVFGSYTYIPVMAGGSPYLLRSHTGLAYTQGPAGSSGGIVNARVFQNTGPRLAIFSNRNSLQTIAAGALGLTPGDYSATINVGGGNLFVEDATVINSQLYAGEGDGLYAGDSSGTFFNVLPELSRQRHEDNARSLDVYNNEVMTPHVGGVWDYHPSTFLAESYEIGPQGTTSNQSPVRGRIRAIRGFGAWLYGGLWTGSQSYLVAGHEVAPGQYDWHVGQRLPHTAMVSRIHFDGITSASNGQEIPQRMWVATDASFGAQANATAPLYVTPIPRNNDNPLADLTFSARYVGSARADMPISDWQAPASLKVYRQVEVQADNLLSGVRYADVYYTVDNGPRTYLGRAQQSPKSQLYFPGLSGAFVTGYQIAVSIESFTASVNTTPIYRSLVVHGAVRANSVDTIEALVYCADRTRDRNGIEMRPAAQQLAELRAMASPKGIGKNPQTLIDLAGATQQVLVLAPIEEQEIYQQGNDYPEIAATVRMAVLEFTTSLPAVVQDGQNILVG